MEKPFASDPMGLHRMLRAGEIVLLGSVVETKWVEPGNLVEIEIDGLGRASALFE